mgnify:CR=1 FL=1
MATVTKSILTTLAILGLSLSVTGVATSEGGKTWDSDRVSELANELAQQVKSMRAAARMDPLVISAGTPAKQRTTQLFLDALKKLERTTAKLARQLANEETRQQTAGTARRLASLLKDATEQGRKLNSSQWTSQYADPALALASQLQDFYQDNPDSTSTP